MNLYEKSLQKELAKWHKEMRKPPSHLNKMTKSVQTKTQSLIPDKVQNLITKSVEKMAESIMFGSGIAMSGEVADKMTLAESDCLVEKAYKIYSKGAIIQGAGCGAGGIFLGMADFPALLSIKVKFLYDCAKFYGYDVREESERLYLLHIFQLAFSSDQHRLKIYNKLMNSNFGNIKDSTVNWEEFQLEYRDCATRSYMKSVSIA